MKKIFICIIWFYWVTAVFVPFVYVLVGGYSTDFIFGSGLDGIDFNYKCEAFVLLTIVTCIITFFICLLAKKKQMVPIVCNDNYFEIFTIIFMVSIIKIGGGNISKFQTANLNGQLIGGLYNYLSFFFDVMTLFVIKFFSESKTRVFGIFLFIVYSLFIGSRAGIMYVILFELCYIMLGYGKRSKQLKSIMLFILIAPFAFLISSVLRGVSFDSFKYLVDSIIARCSVLEILGRVFRAIHTQDYEVDLFTDKYSFIHQLQLIVNSVFPGSIFPDDMMPNTYYRAIFSNYSISFVQDNYMSINITPLGYFSMKYSIIIGVIFNILLVLILFSFCERNRNSLFCRVIAIMGLWEILYFFDWNMIFIRFFKIALTVFLYKMYIKVKEKSKYFIRYNYY